MHHPTHEDRRMLPRTRISCHLFANRSHRKRMPCQAIDIICKVKGSDREGLLCLILFYHTAFKVVLCNCADNE